MKPKTPPSELIEPFTAFPNVLLDCLMPTLRDIEWRLLCVVVRQTIGWREKGGKRKSRDWLTQRQLMTRTGRNSAALSAALDALVRRRLVDACDEAGKMLLTSQERRRHQGRIYFGLCQETLNALVAESSKTPLHKANTTKQTRQNKLETKENKESPPRAAEYLKGECNFSVKGKRAVAESCASRLEHFVFLGSQQAAGYLPTTE